MMRAMEREAHECRSFTEADAHDLRQLWAMTPEQRLEAAKVLRDRAYGADAPDVRAAERAKSGPSEDLDGLAHLPPA
jgi:hypothetical protein